MTSVHSKNLEIFNAQNFVDSVGYQGTANLYFTFGRPTYWTTESSPPMPDTSTGTYVDIWRNMIGGKRITGSDVSLSIPRFNWTSGTIYSQYDDRLDSKDLKNATNKFYVVTDNFNVYKCLYNNNGAPSVVKPTLTLTTDTFQTSDKYIWKYMYSVSTQDQLKFTTSEYIPVKTLKIKDGSTQWEVQNNSVDGAIHVCQLMNGGSGYRSNNIYVQISGDGIGANAFAVRNASTNTISEIIIDDSGSGYTRANVFIFSSNGSGAIAHAMISPSGGHGSDPVTELGGSFVTISVQLNNTESGKLSVSNDFRQVSIIQDPLVRSSSNVFSNTVFSQITTIALSGESVNYEKDEYVFQGNDFRYSSTFRGIVVDWLPENNQLKVIGVEGNPTNDKLIGYSSAAVRTFISATVQPDLQYNSGKLLYIDNIQPILRDASQTEDFKIILSF